MPKMFRVLGFWTLIFAVLFLIAGLIPASLLFFAQTVFFYALSYLNLSERVYIYVFGSYLTLFFVGFTYWSAFMMIPGE
ncbi:DUF2626 domain-containing protein [Tuberibacillus sp. Marseille-P3662]|uniref:DUF2626 domain-containing protein n=1 Tax=Tuberibacillus sp. Marseille-P3662 TaxID=1965358 RepID=UPI000A1CD6D5|nr:DUF2626 domain-containing protein [Tuberibacillus sp. Marseille-P3662]